MASVMLRADDKKMLKPFTLHSQPTPEEMGFGCMKGKIWMADDFDAPLDDFAEYM